MRNDVIDNICEPLFSFGTAPRILTIVLTPILIVIYLSFFLALYFSLGWWFLIALIFGILYLLWYSRTNAVRRVYFHENKIEIVHFFDYKSSYPYEKINTLNEFKQGFLSYEVIIVNLKKNESKKRKIHFYCPDTQKTEFTVFLETKGLKIRPQP